MKTTSASEAFAEAFAARAAHSPLSFPLTAFSASGEVDLVAYESHLTHQLAHEPAAIFVCCGTGEYFSLTLEEYAACVAVAVKVSAGRVPVVAGAGYGTALAIQFVTRAAVAGANAILLLPHYLTDAPQRGLAAHVREVASATELPMIVYQRGQARYAPATMQRLVDETPSVIGLKDGAGDIELLARQRAALPASFLFFNGMPTAELYARAYSGLGISYYSSAVHAFAPEIARPFHSALAAEDDALVDELLRIFYIPFAAIRDRQVGNAVALVKAGARLRGQQVGPVRPPLADPTPGDVAELERLIELGLGAVQPGPAL